MDRYSSFEFSRDRRPMTGLPNPTDIPPLREYPLECDPRRERSYRLVQDIERSRADQPLIDLATDPYHVRRVVVPPSRLQRVTPARVPHARDPRGVQACRRDRRQTQTWFPTLVENDDGVPLEEETCAVLVVDASEWESNRVKSCYIEVFPHECNVRRALGEAEVRLAQIDDDGLLMSAEEADERMQASASARRAPPQLDQSDVASNSGTLELTDSDVQECDSDGEVVPGRARQEPAPAPRFERVEDRPMLEVGEGPDVEVNPGEVPSPRPIDDDEDEDRVIYDEDEEEQVPPVPKPDGADVECVELDADEVVVPKKEPEAAPVPRSDDADVMCVELDVDEAVVPKKEPEVAPVPRPDDADVMCIDLDDDDDEVVVPKQEPPPPVPNANGADIQCVDLELDDLDLNAGEMKQEPHQDAYAPYSRNVQREVLDVVTLDDSDEFEEDNLNSREDTSIPREQHENNRSESGDDLSMTPTCSDVAFSVPPGATKDSVENPSIDRPGEKNVESQDRGEPITEQNSTPSNEIGEGRQTSDCDSASTFGSDLVLDSVISRFRAAENSRDAEAREQLVAESVGFGAAAPETSDIADEAGRSGDGDSDVPTVTRVETVAEVHVPATCDHVDDDVRDSPSENREATAAQYANYSPTKAQKWRRKKRKRLDSGDAGAPIFEDKRHKENDDDDEVAVNDENDSGNVVERVPSPVFNTLSKKRKRSRWQPSDKVLQLSTVSTRAISKPSANVRRTTCFSNFYTLDKLYATGELHEYFKNHTATYNSIEFFCKSFGKLSVFEFLRVSEYVKSNITFWQNRNKHWQQKDKYASIEDVTDKQPSNQLLAITDSPSVFGNDQVPYLHEGIQPGDHETVIASTSAAWSPQSIIVEEDMNNSTRSSWFAQENNAKDGNAKLQRRHSLPMVLVPQQNFGAKRSRSGSEDNPIKLTLKRSQISDDSWVATAGTSTLQNITAQCTLSISNSSVQNVQRETIVTKDVTSASQSSRANEVCTLNRKRFPKFCNDKVVPELDVDDNVNRPLTQKIYFDESKLSFNLQCRIKRRSTSIDSAIASDFDDYTCKRRKIADCTKEYDSSMDNIFNDCSDRLSFNDYTRESLAITELSPDSCIEASRPSSVNICNLNNNNHDEETCKASEDWKLCEDIKNCSASEVASNQEYLNQDERNTPGLENENHFLSNDNASSSSNSSFHLCMEDEPEEPQGIVESLDIQIDYNCNLQKNLNNLEESSEEISNKDLEERHSTDESGMQDKANSSETFVRDVDKLNKKLQILFGESDIDEVKRLVAAKSNCNIHKTDETAQVETRIQLDNSIESRLQTVEEEESTGNPEETCITKAQVFPLNFTESGSSAPIINDEGQEHHVSNKKDSNIDTLLDGSMEKLLCSNEELTPTRTCSQDELIINGISITPDVSNNFSKNVDQDEASPDVLSSRALINNEEQDQSESEDALESETSLPFEKQSSVILNEEVDSDVPHCNINDNTSEQVFQNNKRKDERVLEHTEHQKDGDLLGHEATNKIIYQDQVPADTDDEHSVSDALNLANNMNPDDSSSEDERVLEHQEHLDKDGLGHQETSNINTSSSLLYQVPPETDDERSLDDTMNVENNMNPEHSSSEGEEVLEHEDNRERDEHLLGNQETNNKPSSLLHQDQEETVYSEEGLEEGDFEFLSTMYAINSDDDDDDDYDNQTTVNYSTDTNIQRMNDSNAQMNSERDNQSSRIEDGQASTIHEDENLRSLQNSPSNIRDFDTAKSNSTNADEEDDDIIIEYENISDCSFPKDIKPNINHASNMQVSESSEMHVSNLDINEDRSLDCQSGMPKIVIPTPSSSLHDKNLTIEQDQLQTDTSAENVNALDQSRVEIPVPETDLEHPMANDTPISAIETLVSNDSSDKDASTSPLAPELTIQSSTNITVHLKNLNILQKFNLTKEVIAPEDTNTEDSITFENNDEEQVLTDTLKIFQDEIPEDHFEEDPNISIVTDKQDNSNKDVQVPTLPITIEFKLPTSKAQSDNDYDLLKALNVSVDNEVDIITPEMLNKNKQASSGVIKVKNLNDMLQKPRPASREDISSNQTVTSNENASSNQNAILGNPLPDVAQGNQQGINYGVESLQSQSTVPVNAFSANNALPSAYVIQPAPYTYMINHPIPGGPLQPLVNMCNIVPLPMSMMNNIGQPMPPPNTSSLNQVIGPDNPPIPSPGAPSSDKQIVLASSMFPDMFDSHATSSFCSKTVFNLHLPPLANIILPPPYTILPTDDQVTISQKIESFKWKLLEKLITTLTELENMNVDIIKRNLEILFHTQTLTEETWHFQERLLIVAQCVGALQKLTTDRNYSSIIEAIMGTIHNRVRDRNLLKKLFGIFLKLKERGVFMGFAAEKQPLISELGDLLKQSPTGMSSGQEEVLKYQVKIYQEIFKINNSSLQSDRVSPTSHQTNKQVPVQRSSPMAVQQNIVTTSVSSPVTVTTNSSLQDLVMQEQSGKDEKCLSVQGSKDLAKKCDNISSSCIKCGKKSKILCSRCKIAAYCSPDCQNKHWKTEHHASCNSVKS